MCVTFRCAKFYLVLYLVYIARSKLIYTVLSGKCVASMWGENSLASGQCLNWNIGCLFEPIRLGVNPLQSIFVCLHWHQQNLSTIYIQTFIFNRTWEENKTRLNPIGRPDGNSWAGSPIDPSPLLNTRGLTTQRPSSLRLFTIQIRVASQSESLTPEKCPLTDKIWFMCQ
jgi:hypothetical protein